MHSYYTPHNPYPVTSPDISIYTGAYSNIISWDFLKRKKKKVKMLCSTIGGMNATCLWARTLCSCSRHVWWDKYIWATPVIVGIHKSAVQCVWSSVWELPTALGVNCCAFILSFQDTFEFCVSCPLRCCRFCFPVTSAVPELCSYSSEEFANCE